MTDHTKNIEESQSDTLRPEIPWRLIIALGIPSIVLSAITVVLSNIHLFPLYDPQGVYRFLPGDIMVDFLWIVAVSIVVGLLVILLSPYIATLLWLGHRIVKAKGYDYYLQVRDNRPERHLWRRAVTPVFVALGITFLIVNSNALSVVFVTENFDVIGPEDVIIMTGLPVLFILLIVGAVVPLIFAPLWLLDDIGMISARRALSRRTTPDIEGVGAFYLKLLKGFAGASTIIGYFVIGAQTVSWFMTFVDRMSELSFPIFVLFVPLGAIIGAPLLGMISILVVMIFYELAVVRNTERLEKIVSRFGVKRVRVDITTIAHKTGES